MPTLSAGSAPREMSLSTFHESLDFLSRSGITQVRILGGEPTVHSRFTELVQAAFDRGFTAFVFSGGLIPAQVMELLVGVPAERLTVLLNVGIPGEDSDDLIARQRKVMSALGERALLGVSISSPRIRLGFMLQWIEEFGLRRAVRLGIAHPIFGGENQYLHPRHYPEVGRRVATFALEAKLRQIKTDFDCGWVPCMFPPGAMETLGITSAEVGLRCSPILDILSDGSVISCYPLAKHHLVQLSATPNATALRARFDDVQTRDRAIYLYQACETCEWRQRGECTGGCLAGSLRRLRHASGDFAQGARDDEQESEGVGYQLTVIDNGSSVDGVANNS